MDILYIVGNVSKNDNWELRFSLRSICKFGQNIGRVIVAGTPPDWLSKEAIQVCCSDPYKYKHQNILRCIENVIDKGLLLGDFLYSSDDHFYVKPTDFSAYPYYLKSDNLRSMVDKNDKFYKYHRSLVDTHKLLLNHNLPTKNFSQHCNTHMHTEVFKSIRSIVHESYELPFGVEPTTLIMNKWITLDPSIPLTRRKDAKLDFAHTMDDLKNSIGDRECFSIGDAIFNGLTFTRFCREEFPDKCVFEM